MPSVIPALLMQRGGDPALVSAELAGVIRDAIDLAPRSQQVQLGPSETGDPCARRIGHKLMRSPQRAQPPNWKATVGTAVHAWLAATFDAHNLALEPSLGSERWLVETPVTVGEAGDETITGTVDLYDRITATVVDWKTCGRWMLGYYKQRGPGEAYRRQVHQYGLGMIRAGHPVDTVMIVFLPRQGELSEAYVWHEAYNSGLAYETLQRYAGIAAAVQALGPLALDVLPTAPAWCTRCEFYGEPAGCPGDPGARPEHTPALTLSNPAGRTGEAHGKDK